MEEFIAYLIKNLVTEPDAVNVTSRQGEKAIILEIRVGDADVARVIGKGGRTIQALRTIATTAAARHGARVRLEVVEDDKEETEEEKEEEKTED